MRITSECDYAFRITRHLCKVSKCVGAPEISESCGVPKGFTLKILRKLMLSGIVESQKGAFGGYKIKKEPSEITLFDVVSSVSGELAINKCIESGFMKCSNPQVKSPEQCGIHCYLCKVNSELAEKLKNKTFNDFI